MTERHGWIWPKPGNVNCVNLTQNWQRRTCSCWTCLITVEFDLNSENIKNNTTTKNMSCWIWPKIVYFQFFKWGGTRKIYWRPRGRRRLTTFLPMHLSPKDPRKCKGIISLWFSVVQESSQRLIGPFAGCCLASRVTNKSWAGIRVGSGFTNTILFVGSSKMVVPHT